MFRKRRLTNSGASGSNSDSGRCEWVLQLLWGQPVNNSESPAKKQRVVDGVKILLDVAKESADWFPPLKAALGGVTALIKHYEVLLSGRSSRATDTYVRRNSKMSKRRSKVSNPSLTDSNDPLQRQRSAETLKRRSDG